ncbi:uncharacterized protein LOC133831837 [Humulus lupulus]|uniref:uncharacterized protein LOC133831837 n=1 Tax=Humulus lupulus TaxID=3486 RepID=UPI002B415522|nr:uncharacterized protein LOC133831837 [Humulus lupulus]
MAVQGLTKKPSDFELAHRSGSLFSTKIQAAQPPQKYKTTKLSTYTGKEDPVGERAANILKHLFPPPKPETKRIITFANQSDYISFRHHIYEKQSGPKSVELKEIGPRFELRLFQIKLGTVDQSEAQTEWVIRPYMNTSKKRKFLGD